MNVLTLGARVIGPEPAYECAIAFVGASFSGEPRHQRRLDKVLAIEAAATDHPLGGRRRTAGGVPWASAHRWAPPCTFRGVDADP